MPYIKKLVMHGFKSFVKKTELPFTPGINVVLGPNGSGKSNISDALCFVLGRLSIKSMRAAKAGNLIFMGTKTTAPAKEASVEMIFDNSDKVFSIDKSEISLKRIVRRNGQSIYKINEETKTRQDILLLLAQAGIDPNGFNIILQGEIQNLAKMHGEERRKIIEEVSGISVYESRKQKALKELDKTEERLKEVATILRERTSYLNNLERERQQALKFKKLQKDEQQCKASIIHNDLTQKKKDVEKLNSEIEKHIQEIGKIKKAILALQTSNNSFELNIKNINETIQKSTGFEQEKLNQEIADIRAELAGLNVRLENYEKRVSELSRQKKEINDSISELEQTIKDLKKNLPKTKKQDDIEKKKKELEELEKQRKKFYMTKSEFKSIKERIEDKKTILKNNERDSEYLLKEINSLSEELFDKKTSMEKLNELKSSLVSFRESLFALDKEDIELEKAINVNEHEIQNLERLKQDISKLDICPLCKNKITPEHIKDINNETNPKIENLKKEISNSQKSIKHITEKKQELQRQIGQSEEEINKRESDLSKIKRIFDKKEQIKAISEKIEKEKSEISLLTKREKILGEDINENSDVEQKYENLRIELQEVSLLTEENVDSEISFKQRELERARVNLKQISSNSEEIIEESESLKKDIESKEEILEEKRTQEEELSEKFKKLISERDSVQRKIHENELDISGKQNEMYNIDQITNNLKIAKAKFDAEYENLEIEMLGFPNIEIIKTSKDRLIQKLEQTQEILSKIGSVNLRSLEVYDSVKKEYDSIKEKSDLINKEKESILRIIHEIDIKKKKTFTKTLDALNEIFSNNFSQLSTKGHVFLELENKKDPFEGGVNIIVKTGHGKYFDATSLSGGEQTLVALSLIFAIQEHKPYFFYILDEIDAALDKRNSERLANLLKRYMKRGQYIVITHNDEIISNATALYGISMHEGISKITSLKI